MSEAMTSYAIARRDFEYLETLDELYDQVELDAEREELMRNPTKKFAAAMYRRAIWSWLDEHKTMLDLPKVRTIARRYGFALTTQGGGE